MRSLLRVLGTGLFAVLPVLLIYLLLGQLFEMMMVLTVPIMDFLPEGGPSDLSNQTVAVVLLLLSLLIVGLAALTAPGKRFGDWLERKALNRIPLYDMFRKLSSRLGGNDQLTQFKPVLVRTWPTTRTFAFVVEEHTNGDYTVFLPIAPTPGVGYVCVMSRRDVQPLKAPASEALSAIVSWGHGAEAALRAAPAEPRE